MPKGRPKGSKNKTKEEPRSASNVLNAVVSSIEEGIKESLPKNIGAKERYEHEEASILPKDWDKMGKLDRLKFLTANRKK